MNRKGFKAFDKIKAEDSLKRRTSQYLRAQIQNSMEGESPGTGLAESGNPATIRADYWHAASKRTRRRNRLGFAAALLIVFVLAGGLLYSIAPPRADAVVAYVDIDVNPSIELSIGDEGRVVSASAYNSEGEGILAAADIEGMAYMEAVQALLEDMIAAGYLSQGGLVSMTLQTGSDETVMLAGLNEATNAALQNGGAEAATEIFAVDGQTKQSAHTHNLSPAKYLAITELQQVDDTATFEGCASHSISEIHHMTRRRTGNPDATGEQETTGSPEAGIAPGHHGGNAPATDTGSGETTAPTDTGVPNSPANNSSDATENTGSDAQPTPANNNHGRHGHGH